MIPHGFIEYSYKFLDSYIAGVGFIIASLAIKELDVIYKVLMLFVGLTLLYRGFLNIKKDKLDIKLKTKELKEK